jgi:protein-L-isoaspartate O-methyltransferase
MRIAEDVLAVLDAAEVTGNRLVLQGQLDRKLYADVNKVIEAIGGKWNRGAKAHVFDMPASEVLEPILDTGEYSRTKQDFGQFDSPEEVVERVLQLAKIEPGMTVLEPSAGLGNLAKAAERAGGVVTAVEIDAKRAAALNGAAIPKATVVKADFLAWSPAAQFDRVVMNPPFARQVDIDHVLRAFDMLKPGGRLVSVMSGGVLFRNNRKAADFRTFVDRFGAAFIKLPAGAFASSGTEVSTCILTLVRE